MDFAWFSMGYRFVVKPVHCRSVRAVIRWQTVPASAAGNLDRHIYSPPFLPLHAPPSLRHVAINAPVHNI